MSRFADVEAMSDLPDPNLALRGGAPGLVVGGGPGGELVGQLLDECVRRAASDLYASPGSPPMGRIEGDLLPLSTGAWGADATERFCRDLAAEHWDEIEGLGTTDFGVAHPSGDRFRASVMRQRSAIANQIRNNEINKINDVTQGSRHLGMFRLDDHLAQLVQQGRIDRDGAVTFAQDSAALADRLLH